MSAYLPQTKTRTRRPIRRKLAPQTSRGFLPGLMIGVGAVLVLPAIGRSASRQACIAFPSPKSVAAPRSASHSRDSAVLEVSPSQMARRYDYVTITGQVSNLSSRPLRDVEAVVEIFDREGHLRAVETALIAFSPLSPGEQSPFRVQCRYDGEVGSFRVRFRHLLGAPIPSQQA